MKSLTKVLQDIDTLVAERSFTKDDVIYKHLQYGSFTILVVAEGRDVYNYAVNENIMRYNVMVVDLMTCSVSVNYSHTVICMKEFMGKKIHFNVGYKNNMNFFCRWFERDKRFCETVCSKKRREQNLL